MSEHVIRLNEVDDVVARVSADLLATLAGVQAEGRVPHVVLTGGTVSRLIHREVASRSLAGGTGVDWSRVEIWWGDERFVEVDDPERNAGQARADLLAAVGADESRIHEMPARTSPGDDVDVAAATYTGELGRLTHERAEDAPWFDVLMLGIGPDGHCASLFPGQVDEHTDLTVVGVRQSPKPPPERVSLTMPVLRRADQVWFVATGAEKAPAVAGSVAGADIDAVPAAGPRGLRSTTWYVDRAAGAQVGDARD